MSKVINPIIYLNGALRDDVASFTYETAREKTPENTQNPQREAKHSSHGQITYTVNLTLKPVAGRPESNAEWDNKIKGTSEDILLIKEEDGRYYQLTGVEWTKLSRGGDASTGGTTWTVDGFAKHGGYTT